MAKSPSTIASSAYVRVNQVVVVESLPSKEQQTGTAIFQALHASGVPSEYHPVGTPRELRDLIEALAARAESENLLPILHVEAHGLEDRLCLTGGDVLWSDFADVCRELNRATANHLVFNSAACYGLHSIMASDIHELTPFFAVIGPQTSEWSNVIEDAGLEFYKCLFQTNDMVQASQRLPESYRVYYAERALVIAYARYLKTGVLGSGGRKRVSRLLEPYRQGKNRAQVRQLQIQAKARIRPSAEQLQGYKDRFLLANHPDNFDRFTIGLGDVQRLLASGKLKT